MTKGAKPAKVVVVGAGMSGLAAARELVQRGCEVVVLEARDRAGGRIWTDDSLGTPIDLGAAWIHGKSGNPLTQLAREFKLKTSRTDYGSIAYYDRTGNQITAWDKALHSARPARLFHKLKAFSETLDDDISVAAAVTRVLSEVQLNPKELDIFNRHLMEIESVNAADLSDQSLRALIEGPLAFGGGDLMLPNGYAEMIDCISKGTHIMRGERVTRISHQSSAISIETSKAIHLADAAIITLPLGVLQSGSVRFSPALPDSKQQAIAALKMGSFNKIVLRFAEPFWPRHYDFLEVDPSSKRFVTAFVNWYKHSRQSVLVGLISGSHASEMERKTDERIISETLDILTRMYGRSVTEPTSAKVTRWNSDDFSCGSYSVVSPGITAREFDALAEPVGRLYFAGEATIRKHQGTVHGAYLSGVAAAQKLVSQI
jgi:monoamine oxidase